MSLAVMKRRLEKAGGASQAKRMVKDKERSLFAAIKSSYHAADFQEWTSLEAPVIKGLFNPVRLTENYDTKMISVPWDSKYKVGTYFEWKDTGTNWIIFTQDKTELAYFRGECRLCAYTIKWVTKDRVLMETLASVIGPTATKIENIYSRENDLSADSPNGDLQILIQDNPHNRAFFKKYQTFIIDNLTYRIEVVDRLSMPGVIQLNATEYYFEPIENDVEEEIRNAWNVVPIVPQYDTEYGIEGPNEMKPTMKVEFSTPLKGGEWVILEEKSPAKFVGDIVDKQRVTVHWDSMKSGVFTLGYRIPNGRFYKKAVFVKSMF